MDLVISALVVTLVLVIMVFAVVGASDNNGNFETGDLTGWSEVNSGDGAWAAYGGLSSPVSNGRVSAPPQGAYAATTDQAGGAGSHIITQELHLQQGSPQFLSMMVYYVNEAAGFFTPNSLDHTLGAPFDPDPNLNQQYRIDILRSAAEVDSLGTGDVLLNIFRTEIGDPLMLRPRLITADLTTVAKENATVLLRLVEVDNQGRFRASVDDVQLGETPPPEPNLKQVNIDIEPKKDSNIVKGANLRIAVFTTSELSLHRCPAVKARGVATSNNPCRSGHGS